MYKGKNRLEYPVVRCLKPSPVAVTYASRLAVWTGGSRRQAGNPDGLRGEPHELA